MASLLKFVAYFSCSPDLAMISLAEVRSVCELLGIPSFLIEPNTRATCYVSLPTFDCARRVAARCVLVDRIVFPFVDVKIIKVANDTSQVIPECGYNGAPQQHSTYSPLAMMIQEVHRQRDEAGKRRSRVQQVSIGDDFPSSSGTSSPHCLKRDFEDIDEVVDETLLDLWRFQCDEEESATVHVHHNYFDNVWRSQNKTNSLTNSESDAGSFRYVVESCGKKISQEDKKNLIHCFVTATGNKGPINLHSAEQEFLLLLEFDRTLFEGQHGSTRYLPPTPTNPTGDEFAVVPPPRKKPPPLVGETSFSGDRVPTLQYVVFALHVAYSCRLNLLDGYSLKKRPYIGTTSMPPELTFLMANLARVKKDQWCCDPFCGTGSSLVSCAHWGATAVFGLDMDGRAMRRGSEKSQLSPQFAQQRRLAINSYRSFSLSLEEQTRPSVWTNFKVYQLSPPELVRFNFSLWDCGWRRDALPFLDAIVSDPPYGVREQKLMVPTLERGSPVDQCASSLPAPANSVQGTCISGSACSYEYDTSTMIVDLVAFALKYLVVGGFLVFWHPTTPDFTVEEIPCYAPCIKIQSIFPQMLSLKMVRVLVVMKKIQDLPPPCAIVQPILGASSNRCSENGIWTLQQLRLLLKPKIETMNIRHLLDVTELPGNKPFTDYHAKKAVQYAASRKHWSEGNHNIDNRSDGAMTITTDDSPTTPPPTSSLLQSSSISSHRRSTQVVNRSLNIQIREVKQLLSHIQNRRGSSLQLLEDGGEQKRLEELLGQLTALQKENRESQGSTVKQKERL